MSAGIPEDRHRTGKSRVIRWLRIGGPIERGTQVIVLGFEPIEPFERERSIQRGGSALRQLEEECAVASPRGVGLPGFHQLLARVLPDRIEQPVARLGLLLLLGNQQRLGHEMLDDVENIRLAQGIGSADLFSSG